MKLVIEPKARDRIEEVGGAVYIWAKGARCCGRRTFTLECATEHPGRELELVHASDGIRVFATPGLRLPDELHVGLVRRGRLGAYWNGQAWIG